jgi:predicted transcriptional regulator
MHRSKNEITADILNAAKDKPIGKTRLMYTAYILSVQSREYIAELMERKLLSYDEYNRTFQVTDTGIKFLKLHDEMMENHLS